MLNEFKRLLIIAMRTKDTDIKEVIQMIIASVTNKRIELQRDLTDSEIIEIIKKEIKQIDETLIYCDKREALKQSCIRKKNFLLQYVPDQMTEKQVYQFITDNIDSSCLNIGLTMKKVMPLLKGKTDNKVISDMVKKFFTKG